MTRGGHWDVLIGGRCRSTGTDFRKIQESFGPRYRTPHWHNTWLLNENLVDRKQNDERTCMILDQIFVLCTDYWMKFASRTESVLTDHL